jgi:hypothetical protein
MAHFARGTCSGSAALQCFLCLLPWQLFLCNFVAACACGCGSIWLLRPLGGAAQPSQAPPDPCLLCAERMQPWQHTHLISSWRLLRRKRKQHALTLLMLHRFKLGMQRTVHHQRPHALYGGTTWLHGTPACLSQMPGHQPMLREGAASLEPP